MHCYCTISKNAIQNQLPVLQGVKTISLTKGYRVLVDDLDFPQLSKTKWQALIAGGKVYGIRGVYLGRINGKKTYYTMLIHRQICSSPPGSVTDHKNGDTLDNRRSNLRICNQSQNLANQKSHGGSSKYKGVYWNKGRKKWQAQIGNGSSQNGKQRVECLGRFDSEAEAAAAYDKRAIEIYGEFALVNMKPLGWQPPDIRGELIAQGWEGESQS